MIKAMPERKRFFLLMSSLSQAVYDAMLPPSMMVSFCGGGGVMTAFVQTKSVAKKIFLALSASNIKTIIFTQFYKMTI